MFYTELKIVDNCLTNLMNLMTMLKSKYYQKKMGEIYHAMALNFWGINKGQKHDCLFFLQNYNFNRSFFQCLVHTIPYNFRFIILYLFNSDPSNVSKQDVIMFFDGQSCI